jgi:hypothetical protein
MTWKENEGHESHAGTELVQPILSLQAPQPVESAMAELHD